MTDREALKFFERLRDQTEDEKTYQATICAIHALKETIEPKANED